MSQPIHDQIGVVRYIAEPEWDDARVRQSALNDMKDELIAGMMDIASRGAAGPVTIRIEIIERPPQDWAPGAVAHYGAPTERAGSLAMTAELIEGEPDGQPARPVRWIRADPDTGEDRGPSSPRQAVDHAAGR